MLLRSNPPQMLFLWLGVRIVSISYWADLPVFILITMGGVALTISAATAKGGARMSRHHEIRIKVNRSEYENIKLNADILGMKVAPYIRKVAQTPTIINYDYAAIREHTRQVGKIIHSINLLIFTIEAMNDYQPKEIDGIVEYVQEIMETENKLLATVRKQWEKEYKKK